MMGIHFRPGGAFPFLPFPVSKLNDDVVDLELVWGPQIRAIHDRLLEAETPELKFAILEQALWTVSKGVLKEDSASRAAVAELQTLRAGLSIRDLPTRIGLSQRQLLPRYQEHVWVPPKVLARIFRFQSVLRRLQRERDV